MANIDNNGDKCYDIDLLIYIDKVMTLNKKILIVARLKNLLRKEIDHINKRN